MLSRETQHASAALDSTPKHDDLVFDVGMHRGEDAEFYLRKGFRVVGFEANPYLANYCREQYRVWIDRGLLTIVEGAIVEPNAIESDRRTLSFYINWENSAWGTTNSDWAERNQRLGTDSSRIEVEAVDFTEALRTHGIPHYLKVDIEGNDAVCLRALKQFAARPDYVSIESDKTS